MNVSTNNPSSGSSQILALIMGILKISRKMIFIKKHPESPNGYKT